MANANQCNESESPDGGKERARLAALFRYDILDTPVEAEFDDFTRLAASICKAPIAVINLIDRDRQWFKSEIGLGVRETPLDISICRHAILQKGLFVVSDTTKDPRFQNNPLVTGEPGLRFYAGALLESSEGMPLGTLCILDYRPRSLDEEQGRTLTVLARQVMTTLELRLAARGLAQRNAELEAASQKIEELEGLLSICSQCRKIRDEVDDWVSVEAYVQRHSAARFSHGLCPDCAQTYLDELRRIRP